MRRPRRLRHGEEATLVEHLEELRTRVIISLLAIAAAFAFTFAFHETIIRWLSEPLPNVDGKQIKPITLSPSEPFMTSVTVSLYAALALALPVILGQFWGFMAPALEPARQRTITKLMIAATLLLGLGMTFAYFAVLPTGLDFLLGYDSNLYDSTVRAKEYYGFAISMIVAIGALFELPVLVLGLVRLRVLSASTLRHNRRIGLGLCLIVVVLLPGVDFVTMAVQALPVLILFEASVWAAVLAERRWHSEPGSEIVTTTPRP